MTPLEPRDVAMLDQAKATLSDAISVLEPYCALPLWWPFPVSWWVRFYRWRRRG